MSDPRRDNQRSAADDNWRRWQLSELPARGETAPEPPAPGRAPKPAGADSKALAREHTQAREAGRREGYQAGLAEGREQGHTEGFAQGREQGLEQGRSQAAAELEQRLREQVAPLLPLARQFSEAITALDDDIANSLVELAYEVGRQLARDAFKARPKAILDLVRELLHSEPALTGKPRLWLHPADLALVRDTLGDEFDAANWVLQPDDQVTRGGCRVTSASGELDASWETRCQAVRSQLRKRRSGTQDPMHSLSSRGRPASARTGGEVKPQ